MENTQSLKDTIAGISKPNNEAFKTTSKEATKPMPVLGTFDNIAHVGDAPPELADDYINQKLDNSGVLVRFFDKIFNENDAEETNQYKK